MNELETTIASNYSLNINNLHQIKGGWSARSYVIETINKKYFAKVYDNKRASTETNIKNAEIYGDMLIALVNKGDLKNNITTPIKNNQNNYLTRTDNFSIELFEYIDGVTIAEDKMNDNEKIELANIINTLHQSIDKIELSSDFPKEDFNIPNVIKMEMFLNDNRYNSLLLKYKIKLSEYLEYLQKAAGSYKNKDIPFVLCHTDIHK